MPEPNHSSLQNSTSRISKISLNPTQELKGLFRAYLKTTKSCHISYPHRQTDSLESRMHGMHTTCMKEKMSFTCPEPYKSSEPSLQRLTASKEKPLSVKPTRTNQPLHYPALKFNTIQYNTI